MSQEYLFSGDLLLAGLSEQAYPAVNTFSSFNKINLSQLVNVDSAGVAYLVQIKIQYPMLILIHASPKLLVIASLYGVEHFFEKEG